MAENGAHNPHVPLILDLWERTLDAIESGDTSTIDTEVDWAIKKKLMDNYRERHGLGLDAPRIAQLDLTYHDISRTRGLYYLLQSRGAVRRVVDDTVVKDAVDAPPQTTRAKLRGDFVRRAQELGRDYTVDWVHLKLNDRAHQTSCARIRSAAWTTAWMRCWTLWADTQLSTLFWEGAVRGHAGFAAGNCPARRPSCPDESS